MLAYLLLFSGFLVLSAKLVLLEVALCTYIIGHVKYTEIDWSTYMQQVQCFADGIWNYSKIEGDTGPVVYPAGHLYSYGILYLLTNKGLNILRAQYIFEGLYLLTVILVPPFVLLFITCISYRIHSIFLLRLFNDPIAMLLFYIALNFWVSQKWTCGAVFYSLAVSVKMNVLLYAPAVFFIFLLSNRIKGTIKLLTLCGIIQVLLALPFLITDPFAYVARSFDLGRVFLFKWTVNWRFLPETVFLSRTFHICLLILHIFLLLTFALSCWFRRQGGLLLLLHILYVVFTSNLLGIAVARSLHYQFYSWYFHSLPYLLFSTLNFEKFDNKSESSVILIAIEICWNTYPSTIASSLCLQLLHIVMIMMMFIYGISHGIKKSKKA
uniref:dolichyl-P-Man:Man5GlcNAc2-PP-dolichol alpha-1,3-mannosyltransferase n=1 Tax=Syphacia muris TaxID=451379 RepID=A0A0N5A9G5_9BILA